MDFGVALKILDKYGLEGIALCIVGILVFYGGKWLHTKISGSITATIQRQNDTLSNSIKDLSVSLATAMVDREQFLINAVAEQNKHMVEYLVKRDNIKKDTHDTLLEERLKNTENIEHRLNDLLNYYHCDRILLYEFHNSLQNLSGIPFARFSCNYGRPAPGIVSVKHKLQNIPFSTINTVVQDIIESPDSTTSNVWYNVSDLAAKNPDLAQLLTSNGVKSVLFKGLYGKNNNMIGLISMEYIKHQQDTHVSYTKLLIEASKIESMLTA